MSFISPSPSLFSLVPPPPAASNPAAPQVEAPKPMFSYDLLNSPSSTEQQIEQEIERIATGLFSVVVTNGTSISLTYEISLMNLPQVMFHSSDALRVMPQKWWRRRLNRKSEMLFSHLHGPMALQLCSYKIQQDYPICSDHVRNLFLF